MRNEANREVCGATALRKCETKPIRRGGGHGENAWGRCAERSQSAAIRCQATKPPNCGGGAHGKIAWAISAERSQSHFRTVWQSGNPPCFQYRTGIERFERM